MVAGACAAGGATVLGALTGASWLGLALPPEARSQAPVPRAAVWWQVPALALVQLFEGRAPPLEELWPERALGQVPRWVVP
jgi:hypothetical protein